MSPDRIIILSVSAIFGLVIFNQMHQSKPSEPAPAIDFAQQNAERARALETARKAEEADRERRAIALREEQRARAAQMFNQRYNTDRTPIGSIGGESTREPAPQGFSVVKPALPPGQSGGGFREVRWPKANQQ